MQNSKLKIGNTNKINKSDISNEVTKSIEIEIGNGNKINRSNIGNGKSRKEKQSFFQKRPILAGVVSSTIFLVVTTIVGYLIKNFWR